MTYQYVVKVYLQNQPCWEASQRELQHNNSFPDCLAIRRKQPSTEVSIEAKANNSWQKGSQKNRTNSKLHHQANQTREILTHTLWFGKETPAIFPAAGQWSTNESAPSAAETARWAVATTPSGKTAPRQFGNDPWWHQNLLIHKRTGSAECEPA